MNRGERMCNPLPWKTRCPQGPPKPKSETTKEIIMLNDLLNSIAFTVIVAIAAAAAAVSLQTADVPNVARSADVGTPAAEPSQAVVFGADAAVPVAELPVAVVQLPTVVVVGHREPASGPTSVAAAN
ncbi:MAG: hypothetical protein ABI887_10270 [Burkholderiales bacterium]